MTSSEVADKPQEDRELETMECNWNGYSKRYWKCKILNKSNKELLALTTTRQAGSLVTIQPNIPPGSHGYFVWAASFGPTGARGVVHYKLGADANSPVLNLMVSIPFNFAMFDAWCNVKVSSQKESFDNLYQGKGGCSPPTRAGEWGYADGCRFFLTNEAKATFNVVFTDAVKY